MIAKMKAALPASRVYSWVQKAAEFAGGSVHAKIAVADEDFCFISSANLTGNAMEKNMEAGVLIRGGAIPTNLHKHLEALGRNERRQDAGIGRAVRRERADVLNSKPAWEIHAGRLGPCGRIRLSKSATLIGW